MKQWLLLLIKKKNNNSKARESWSSFSLMNVGKWLLQDKLRTLGQKKDQHSVTPLLEEKSNLPIAEGVLVLPKNFEAYQARTYLKLVVDQFWPLWDSQRQVQALQQLPALFSVPIRGSRGLVKHRASGHGQSSPSLPRDTREQRVPLPQLLSPCHRRAGKSLAKLSWCR